MEILVLQAGWVVVGRPRREGDMIIIDKAAVIRRWGTDSGLGQLAAEGPRQATQLDAAPRTIKVHPLSILLSFPCDEKAWAKWAK